MISKSQIEQYNEEGYTIVEDVFNMDELNPILNEFEEIVEDFANKAFQAGKITNKHEDKDDNNDVDDTKGGVLIDYHYRVRK